jgi:NAD(P)-dependent dehydrogenase (short-subunit alcohol dehydrogenase family)
MAELIKTPFGFSSTAMEVVEGIDLSGKRAIVTGSASGIGIETARALAKAGAEVTLAVRNTEAGERVAADIKASTGNDAVRVGRLELLDWNSIDAFVQAWHGPLHILINNAAVMALPTRQLSPEGHELQFATNHLGHFRLSVGLHDALKEAGSARIVARSSVGHLRSPVVFEDIDFNSHPYDPRLAYGQSKTANVLFAVEATRRWRGDGITANAVHPGAIAETNLARYYDPKVLEDLRTSGVYTYKTPEQGAATSVLVATSPLLAGIGGHYFEHCNEAEVVANPTTEMAGVAAYALDTANAKRLWDMSDGFLAQSS